MFIGQDLNKEGITKALNDVVLTDKEWAQWEKVSLREPARQSEVYSCQTMKSRKSEEKKIERLVNIFDGKPEAR